MDVEKEVKISDGERQIQDLYVPFVPASNRILMNNMCTLVTSTQRFANTNKK